MAENGLRIMDNELMNGQMDGAEPTKPTTLFHTFLDKISLENYLIDKMLFKRGVTEECEVQSSVSQYNLIISLKQQIYIVWLYPSAHLWLFLESDIN